MSLRKWELSQKNLALLKPIPSSSRISLHNIPSANTANTSSQDRPGAISNIALTAKIHASFLSTHAIPSATHLGLPFPSTATIEMFGHSKEFILCFMKSTCNAHPYISKYALIVPVCHTIAVSAPFSPFLAIPKSNYGSDSQRFLRYCSTFHLFSLYSNVSLINVQYNSSACSTATLDIGWRGAISANIMLRSFFVFSTLFSPNNLFIDAVLAHKQKFLNCSSVRCDWDGLTVTAQL